MYYLQYGYHIIQVSLYAKFIQKLNINNISLKDIEFYHEKIVETPKCVI